ncbi:type IV pilin N-terminal domain-containing protein, partial [uncultured Methanofollis sp.]|uniref:type IV pilin N-terminal domain-containing protein n=1 Tax=uncultured Methanofollis sp. TaxID=262500 RepID=UPI00260E0311
VAITVILAAVIAAFVFGMTGNVQSTKNVAVTTSVNNEQQVVATLQGGADATSLKYLNMSINGNDVNHLVSSGNLTVGASMNSGSTRVVPGKTHVVIVATFKDGSSQVVIDKNY